MNKPLTCIIVDDEPLSRMLLKKYLDEFPEIEVVGEAASGTEGFQKIQEWKPNLLFLDIQMPGINGLELAGLVDYSAAIVFTTAFDQYALKAFDTNAIDYLLKPFSKDRLKQAIDKATRLLDKKEEKSHPMPLRDLSITERLDRIVVKVHQEIKIIPTSEIVFVEAADDYVEIHTLQGKFLKQHTLKYLEDYLPKGEFIRIHRSFLVNIRCIQKIEPMEKTTYLLHTESGHKLPVSRSGYTLLRSVLDF